MTFAPLPPGPYRLIYADPAWKTESYDGKKSVPTQAGDPYETLTTEKMTKLPVRNIVAKDALLVMWAVGSHLRQAMRLGESWGFEFNTDLFIWLKERLYFDERDKLFMREDSLRIGMGRHTRKQAEQCLLFSRGKGCPVLDHSVRQCIFAPPSQHSRKPPETYDRLHRLYGDVPRLELFARNNHPGWDAWGNEVGKYE